MKKITRKAQSLIEYGLILALVAIIALAVLSKFGQTITNVGNNTDNAVTNASEGAGQSYCDSIRGDWNASNSFCDTSTEE